MYNVIVCDEVRMQLPAGELKRGGFGGLGCTAWPKAAIKFNILLHNHFPTKLLNPHTNI